MKPPEACPLTHGDALDVYDTWRTPTTIISDGAYGVGGFPGDPKTPTHLPDWYRPHIAAWTRHATPATTLWLWNTEVGWATLHPLLVERGWEYQALHVWDKGIGHVAGNVNSKTLRRFPVTTEVCALYSRPTVFETVSGETSLQEWLRDEWVRSGLPLSHANRATGVKNAATRKWLTHDTLWYPPPGEAFVKLADYANAHGKPAPNPSQRYYLIGGVQPSSAEWEAIVGRSSTRSRFRQLRYKWNYQHGVTNVWATPAVRGKERLKAGSKSVHPNQKPERLMEHIVRSVTDPGDVVWEPFGGLCTATVVAVREGRIAYAAETNEGVYRQAEQRLRPLLPRPTSPAGG